MCFHFFSGILHSLTNVRDVLLPFRESKLAVGERNALYPLPKLDIICFPQVHGMGMEGWEAIAILKDYFLISPTIRFFRRRRIARLLGHEIVHQWLGNLMTPGSMGELWLKESAARFFEFIALEALNHVNSHV